MISMWFRPKKRSVMLLLIVEAIFSIIQFRVTLSVISPWLGMSLNTTVGVFVADGENNPSKCVIERHTYSEDGLLSGSVVDYKDPATNEYLPEQWCKVFINVPSGSAIFYTLHLESCATGISACNCDFVTFTTLNDNNVYCDNLTIKGATWHSIDFAFKTDGGTAWTGFNLTWAEVRHANSCSPGMVISETSGYFASPVGSNGLMLPNQFCRWKFKARPGYVWRFHYDVFAFPKSATIAGCLPQKLVCGACLLQQSLKQFNWTVAILEYVADNFEYSDWGFFGYFPHSIRCGHQVPLVTNYTSFTSDASVLFLLEEYTAPAKQSNVTEAEHESQYGLRIYYEQIPEPCRITRLVSGNLSGVISSDLLQDAGLYRANENCKWRISTGMQLALRLTFSKFEMAPCIVYHQQVEPYPCDGVTIYDGDSTEDEAVLVRLNNETDPEPFYISKQSVVIVQFTTDLIMEASGFSLHYEAIDSDEIPCEATQLLLSDNGTLTNYRRTSDGAYRTNEDCNWHIIAESGKRLLFQIRQLDIQSYGSEDCPGDWFAIYDGGNKRAPELTRICGNYSEKQDYLNITTSGNEAFISFRTDSENDNATGFEMDFTSMEKEPVTDPTQQSTSTIIILATVIPAVVIIIAIVGTLTFVRRRRLLRIHKAEAALERYVLTSYISPAANFKSLLTEFGAEALSESIEKLNISEAQLQLGDVIGHGNFGVVLKATYTPHPSAKAGAMLEVAVKIVKSSRAEDCVDLVREAILVSELDHKNVMKMLGIAIISETPHVVFPYMTNGNLRDFLRKTGKQQTESTTLLLQFCQQVCDGMCYLSEKGYIHRDLAARNILVSEQKLVKISDFGLGRCLSNSGYYNWLGSKKKAIPIRWHPPESYQAYIFDSQSDVWSFGVLCWEIFTLCETEPYAELQTDEVALFIEKGNRLLKPDICTEEMYAALMLNCWRKNRFQRPTFKQLSAELSKIFF